MVKWPVSVGVDVLHSISTLDNVRQAKFAFKETVFDDCADWVSRKARKRQTVNRRNGFVSGGVR